MAILLNKKQSLLGTVSDHVPRPGKPGHAAVRRQFGIQVFVFTEYHKKKNTSRGVPFLF